MVYGDTSIECYARPTWHQLALPHARGAAERKATLARLATMGLGEGQRAGVVALEVLPAVIAAAVAAWACVRPARFPGCSRRDL